MPEHTEIRHALRQFKALADLNVRFLQHCAKPTVPPVLNVRLNVADTALRVEGFGQVAVANARHVLVKRGFFAVEYVFRIAQDDRTIEVWRFSLTPAGRIVEESAAETGLCDALDGASIEQIWSYA